MPVGQGARNNILLGGLGRPNLFDTNVKATSIDEDIFSDQTEVTAAEDADLVLVLDTSETPDKIKFITKANFIGEGLVAITGNVDNRVITATGSALVGESNLLFDGTILTNDGGEVNIDISGGDPHLSFQIAGTDEFTIGVDDDDSDSLKIDTGGTVGGATKLTLDTSGNMTLAGGLTITGNLLPAADDTHDIGSASAAFQDLFLEGDITLTDAGTIATSAGDLTVDAEGDIILDANGANVTIKDDGTSILDIANSSTDVEITLSTADKNLKFKGTDGSSAITALDIDMAAAGAATFNSDVVVGGLLKMPSNTASKILVADGSSFEEVAIGDLSEISSIANDDVFIAIDTTDGALKKVSRSQVVSGLAASGAITDVVDDSTPQLGGNLDMNGNDIVTTSNASIDLAPNGTGTVVIRGNDNQGTLTLNCENNSHGQKIKAAPHSESASNTLTLPSTGGDARLVSTSSTATLTNKSFGDDVDIFEDANNADVTLRMGTSATESLAISVLNGGSNKTAESVTFTTATASSTGDHGKFTFNVDGTDIFDVDDSGINLASGKTFRIDGTAIDGDITSVVAGDGLTGGGTDGDVTINVAAGNLIDVQANQVDVDLTEAGEAAIANGDFILFLDGGATGTHAKEAIADVATLFAGTGLTATNSVIAVDASQAITALTGGDLTIFEDANNADVSLKLGTSATESLTIEVLNGGSNKTAEEVHFSTATASGTANHGKMVFDIDGTDQFEINDSGVTVTGDLTITGDDLFMNTNTAGHILVGDDTNYNPVAVSGDIGLASNGAMTIQAGAVEHGMLADDIISGQDEITSGFAAADELMYSDAGTIKRVGLDTLATKLFSVASAGTVAQASDHMLFLDGGATGDVIVESIDDFLSAIAGSGISVSSSQLTAASGAVTALNNATANELVTVGATTTELDAEANLTFDGTDLKLLKDANNADVSVVLGTADAESLTIQVNNGSSNKAAESVTFATATAESGGNAGKMIFNVDGADILTIDDGGIDFESGKTISVGGTDVIFGDSLNSLTAGAIADGDSIAFIDANDSNATKKEAVADLATLFAGTGLTASSSVIGVDASQAITALTGGDLTLFEDANNADVSFKMGTSATEAFSIEVLNGGSNKTNEEVKILTTTASGTGNHGKISVHIDEVEVLDIDDGGIDLASGMTFAVDGTDIVSAAGAITGITSLLATDIKIGEDDQTKIDFEDANKINFYANNAKEVELAENSLSPGTSDGTALGTTSLMWSDLFLASGSVINFNNGDVTLTHSSNTLTIAGGTLAAAGITGSTGTFSGVLKTDDTTAATSTTDGSLQTDGGLSVAGDAVIGDDLILLSDAAVLKFGADSEATITHADDAGLTFNSTTTFDEVVVAADKDITMGASSRLVFGTDVPNTDHEATGVIVKITSSGTLARGVPVYIDGSGTVAAADADAVGTMPAIGINTTDLSGGAGEAEILISGIFRDDNYAFTPGDDVFVGTDPTTTATTNYLGITTTAPSGSGDTVQKIGVALTADTVFFNFNTAEVLLA